MSSLRAVNQMSATPPHSTLPTPRSSKEQEKRTTVTSKANRTHVSGQDWKMQPLGAPAHVDQRAAANSFLVKAEEPALS